MTGAGALTVDMATDFSLIDRRTVSSKHEWFSPTGAVGGELDDTSLEAFDGFFIFTLVWFPPPFSLSVRARVRVCY